MSKWIGARVEDDLRERLEKQAEQAPYFGNLSSLIKTVLLQWLEERSA